ncbi:MAG: dodecin family protein [Halofilum sp. (in: g-proteobacteria)]
MSVAKVIEISAESDESFEDAIRQGIERAEKSVRNVRGAWVAQQKVDIEGGRITRFRVDLKVTFLLDD